MFGYMVPFKPELKFNEYDIYQAAYCGLCRRLGGRFGPFARMTLSYDFAFLVLLGLSIEEPSPSFRRCVCPANPLKRKQCCEEDPGGVLALSADAAMLSVYYKTLDNIRDSGPLGRIRWRIALSFAARARTRAMESSPETDRLFRTMTERQNALESDRCEDVDMAAEPTALALSELFGMLVDPNPENSAKKRVLERMGYLCGRYIYLADALDDWKEDHKHRRYNPFPADENGAVRVKTAVRSLYLTIAELDNTFALLEVVRYRAILENILVLGLKNKVDRICRENGYSVEGEAQ